MNRRKYIKTSLSVLPGIYFTKLDINRINQKKDIVFIDDSHWINNLGVKEFSDAYSIQYKLKSAKPFEKVSYNIPNEKRYAKVHWNKTDNKNKWFPQGISGNDNCDIQTKNKRLLISSSYYNIDKDLTRQRARISLFDITDINQTKYQNILLVANRCDDTVRINTKDYNLYTKFNPIVMHAGGVAWHKNYLYVVHTKFGIRVFDLTKFIKANESLSHRNYCGKLGNNIYGLGHSYILPQIGYYRINAGIPFSCISIETNDKETILWTSQYKNKDVKSSTQMFGFVLDSDGVILPKEKVRVKDFNGSCGKSGLWKVNHVQGALKIGDEVWASRSGAPKYKGSTGRLVTQYKTNLGIRWRWPSGPEDLYFEKSKNIIWSQTEFKGDRYLFGIKRNQYNIKQNLTTEHEYCR